MYSKINTPPLLDKINQPSLLETQCDQLKEAIQQERNYYISRLTLLEQKLDELKSSLVTPQEPFINKPCISSGVCEHDKNAIIDKIRAEIKQKCCITVGRENDPAITLYDVLQIIDKYKEESEG